MTQDLYRKEALEHRHRTLYGEVILKSPPATWAITVILAAVIVIFISLLVFATVQTDDGAVPLWKWLFAQTN